MSINFEMYNFNITLIIKNTPYDDDDFGGGTYKLEFENAFHRIDGGYMIVEQLIEGNIVGQVFELNSIKSYKICQ